MCNARSQRSRNEGNTEHGVKTLTAPLTAGECSVQQANITANVELLFHIYKSMFEIQRD